MHTQTTSRGAKSQALAQECIFAGEQGCVAMREARAWRSRVCNPRPHPYPQIQGLIYGAELAACLGGKCEGCASCMAPHMERVPPEGYAPESFLVRTSGRAGHDQHTTKAVQAVKPTGDGVLRRPAA